jgi:hypothetical protein
MILSFFIASITFFKSVFELESMSSRSSESYQNEASLRSRRLIRRMFLKYVAHQIQISSVLEQEVLLPKENMVATQAAESDAVFYFRERR